MKCERCGGRTAVVDSHERKGMHRRVRVCRVCGFSFETRETFHAAVETNAKVARDLKRGQGGTNVRSE